MYDTWHLQVDFFFFWLTLSASVFWGGKTEVVNIKDKNNIVPETKNKSDLCLVAK